MPSAWGRNRSAEKKKLPDPIWGRVSQRTGGSRGVKSPVADRLRMPIDTTRHGPARRIE